ncbi:MAG: UDP-3-O-[3-hydroxymyristoyl] N-acetylglucosamine deacetylase [Rhodobacteraceae bacterium]|nr:UDP-3-O-[3-hydroxymyristoyl] N-acetylglucosamine deacetylase [Paracoccaceae bacterium]
MYQTTLEMPAILAGHGLHTGRPARVVLRPAPAGTGVRFRRVDLAGDNEIAARHDNVIETRLSTLIGNSSGVRVGTIEHLMAALAGLGVHNVVVEVDGPEVPIMDGSASPFVAAIHRAGLRQLGAPLRVLRLRRAIEVQDGSARARLDPADTFALDFRIDFSEAAIGRQSFRLDMAGEAFERALASARTFCRSADIAAMRSEGLALGGSYENAIVVEGERVLNPEGLRYADEYVRHKMLDAVGDLALAGAPLLALYTGDRAGHRMTNLLLHRMFSTSGAFTVETCTPAMAAALPGLEPAPGRAVA